jgi:hypothetical protein
MREMERRSVHDFIQRVPPVVDPFHAFIEGVRPVIEDGRGEGGVRLLWSASECGRDCAVLHPE